MQADQFDHKQLIGKSIGRVMSTIHHSVTIIGVDISFSSTIRTLFCKILALFNSPFSDMVSKASNVDRLRALTTALDTNNEAPSTI